MVKVIAQWQRPVAPREALVVIHQSMCPTLHRQICMVMEMAILKLVYRFKQSKATAPLATPLGGPPVC